MRAHGARLGAAALVAQGLWGMTPLPGGGQRWTLLNGDDPSKVVTMDVGIRLNRANSVVIQDRQVRRIEADDGTVVDENRRQDAGGVWITEKKVGSGGKTAYALVTHERGTVLKQELKSNAGHFVRGGDGKDFGAASWWEVDAAGQRKPGTAWAGDIFIDDDGNLIKQGYVSEPDPGRPGDVRARRDGRGARIVETVTSIFTSGESEQRFGHGGLVRRDRAGEVLWTVTPGGETTRYYYRGEGEAKVLVGMREGANPRWTWVDHWVSRAPSRDNFAAASSITTSVYRRSGDAQWQDADRKTSTTYHVDGSRGHVTGTGTLQRIVELDAQGRPTRFVTPETPEFRLYYATDGRLERVDHAVPPGFSIIDTAYQPPPGLPLTAKEVRRGTRLEFVGWGNDRYVSFLDAKGHRVDFWGRATVIEHDGEAGAPLVYLNFRDYFTIVKRGAPTPSGRITVAERIDGLSGAGWDQSVVYSDAQGRRWQRFASGALSEFDGAGRLVRHTDERNRVFELAYSADGSLQSAATPDRRLRRDSLSAGILDFQLTKDGTLVLTLESGLEMYTFPGGRRVTLGGEGTLSRYDHRDRLSTQDHLDGGRVLLTYDSETASSATRQELAGNKRPREGTASLDIALDQGRLRTLERSVTGRDGKTTRTVVARRDGREWVDEERFRYAAAWIGGNPRRVFLVTGDGRYMRVVHDDGSETRVGYDEQYECRFRVTRNAWGEVTDVQHADGRITRFTRDGTGAITIIQQGSDIVVRNSKETPVTFGPSTSRQSKWAVSLLVDARGTQTWSGTNGIRRTVSPDGRIEVSRPDGSRSSFSPDGTPPAHLRQSPRRRPLRGDRARQRRPRMDVRRWRGGPARRRQRRHRIPEEGPHPGGRRAGPGPAVARLRGRLAARRPHSPRPGPAGARRPSRRRPRHRAAGRPRRRPRHVMGRDPGAVERARSGHAGRFQSAPRPRPDGRRQSRPADAGDVRVRVVADRAGPPAGPAAHPAEPGARHRLGHAGRGRHSADRLCARRAGAVARPRT